MSVATGGDGSLADPTAAVGASAEPLGVRGGEAPRRAPALTRLQRKKFSRLRGIQHRPLGARWSTKPGAAQRCYLHPGIYQAEAQETLAPGSASPRNQGIAEMRTLRSGPASVVRKAIDGTSRGGARPTSSKAKAGKRIDASCGESLVVVRV